ncbi:uncharacterized protein involved in exopolysaccharide biosynthesis [Silvibacterium bohemicum]|uniref:Uncharacterized protein involved in exopolysaccharide biosynthesis n=1 Tax=Silvibacterium bohemicum TaxID=1577686 RepID=A0A841JUY2_9BACT|nr:Wzz/FepE/Etk N-terminal domain-containing protein [Silvibacterium bohemicum]MBB6145192.1 uncharacterized protein involved in exopolysaccharide biosynthesis [Silvibacterium bohemicum]
MNNRFSENKDAADISMRDLVAPLFRKKRLILLTFLGVFAAVILLFALMGPKYTSHMAILVNRERLDPLVSTEATTQMVTTSTPVSPEEVNSEIELLTSRDVLEKVVVANGLEKPKKSSWFHSSKPISEEDRIARTATGLAKKIKTNVTTKTNVIEVQYSSGDPKLAYGVLKSLGELYTAKHVAVHRPAGSYDFFAHETQRYKDELDSAEAKLRNFSRENDVAAPDLQRTNLALQVATSIGIQHLAEQAIASDEERVRNDQSQLTSTPQRSATQQSTAAADKLLEDLNATLLAAQTKRTQMAAKYDPSFPLVTEADQEVAQAKAAIVEAEKTRYVTETTDRDPTFELIREDLVKSQEDLAAQRANLAATKRSIQAIQGQMVDLDQKSISQNDLLREVKADEDNYLLYLSKREQERTTDALDSTRIANVAIAVPPAIPVLPTYGWPLIIIAGIGVAGVLSLSTAYAADYFDSSFHTPAQVVDMLGIPVVVTVSKKKSA